MAESSEAAAWRDWLGQHGSALVLFARQWSASAADAEDAVQGGFLKFWRTRERACDQVAWLYACVRSTARDLGRGNRRRVQREQRVSRPDEPAFDYSLHRAERESQIAAALARLPAEQREVVVMRIWGGLTFAQIGETLGVPINTAASRYRHALLHLEARLSPEMAHD
jgi:RNA polymerase sigma-70 factor (ECF subfamily)